MIVQIPLCYPQYKSRGAGAGILGTVTQQCINLYPERVTNLSGKSDYILVTTPGLRTLGVTANNAACRGAYFTSTGVLYSVNGNTLYEWTAAGIATSRGTLSTSTGNVSMTDNSIHLVIADGTSGYTFLLGSAVAAAVIVDANYPDNSMSVTFQDGYIIAAKAGTGEFYLSQVYGATNWTPENSSTAEFRADVLMAVKSVGGQLYLIGERTTEIWYNTGNAEFIFERVSGAVLDVGTPQGETVAEMNGGLVFLGNGNTGRGSVVMVNGTSLTRISTPVIESLISKHTLSSSYAYCYQQDGHQFYVLSFPSNGYTYVYDMTEGAWHKRFSGAFFNLYKPRKIIQAYSSGAELPYAFDNANGNIYEVSGAYNQEDGVSAGRAVTVGPVFAGRNRAFHSRFRMDMDTQADTDASSSISVTLGISDNGLATPIATSYTQTKTVAASSPATFEWNRLGSSRERYYQIKFTGAFRAVLKGAEVEIKQGRF